MSSQPPELARPLDEDELDELEHYLASESLPEDTMPLATLHGFLTALVIGPNHVPPDLWLGRIWGDLEPVNPLFDSDEQAEHIMALVFRLMNSIALAFADDPDAFEPLHACDDGEDDDDDGGVSVGDDEELRILPEYWCEGFIRGTLLDREGWQPLFDDPEDALLVLPILAHAVDPEEFRSEVHGPTEVFWSEDGVELIAQAAIALHAYWAPRRSAAAPS